MALVAAGVLASLASGPSFDPPEPDSCDEGLTGGAMTLEVAGPDETSFVALDDDDAIDYITGGQGLPMIGVRFRLTGPNVPACAAHDTSLVMSGAVFASENVPLATYEQSDGSRTTKPLFLVLGDPSPSWGDRITMRATVAGVSIERALWVGERALDPPDVLVADQQNPMAIAVGGGFVYWASSVEVGAISRAPVDGGSVEVLADLQRRPTGLAIDADRVYWSNADDGTIATVVTTGGAVTTIATGQYGAGAVALDDTYVYWLAGDGSSVSRATKQSDGQPVELLGDGLHDVAALAIDDTYVYLASRTDDTIARLAKAGGDPEVLATDQGAPSSIVVDGVDVYWSNELDGQIMWLDGRDGSVSALAEGYVGPVGIAADAANVYVADPPGGQVAVVARDGSGDRQLVRNQTAPWAVAVDASRVYWTDNVTGQILAAPLPRWRL